VYDPFPHARPPGLSRHTLPAGAELWRIEANPFHEWTWEGFPQPWHRFDPAPGLFRTRYGGRTLVGAARERYLDAGRIIPDTDRHHCVTRLVATRPMRILDLRTEANLDALDIDDQISTGHHDAVLAACHDLGDAVRRWWGDLDGLVYRSRTTPESSVNVAFFSLDGLAGTSRRLEECEDELDDLALNHGFLVRF
jgi:hypothetical protein